MDAFKNSLFAVNILIIFVICFLINYTTKFNVKFKEVITMAKKLVAYFSASGTTKRVASEPCK